MLAVSVCLSVSLVSLSLSLSVSLSVSLCHSLPLSLGRQHSGRLEPGVHSIVQIYAIAWV